MADRPSAAARPDPQGAALVLVVDDDPDVRLSTVRIMRSAGYAVAEAETGTEALSAALRLRPALVLLDAMLPDTGGLEVCRRLKADPRLVDTFVVLCSGSRTPSDEQADGLAAGADGHIARPVTHKELVARVELMLRLRSVQAALRHEQRQLEEAQHLAGVGSWQYDLRTGEVTCSRELCRICGLDDGAALVTRDLALQLCHPEDRQRVLAAAAGLVEGMAEGVLEFRITTPRGEVRALECRAELVPGSAGTPLLARGVVADITTRRRTEEVQAFLAQTSSGTVAEPFFLMLARYLARVLGMDFVCIDRLEPDGLAARTVAVWCDGRFEDNVVYALADTPCGQVVGKQVCCYPASVCRFFPRDQVLADLRAESYVGVTLFGHTGHPIGLIAVIGRSPLPDRVLAEATLKLVAVRAAAEMEHLDAVQALRDSEDRFAKAFETAPYAITITRVEDGALVEVNSAFTAMAGVAREQALASSTSELSLRVDPADRQRVVEDLQAGRSVTDREFQFRGRGGRTITGQYSAQLVELSQGRCVLSSIRDISERKLAERESRIALALQRVRNEILRMECEDDWVGVARVVREELGGLVAFQDWAVNLLDAAGGDEGTLTVTGGTVYRATVSWRTRPAMRQAIESRRPVYRRTRSDPLFSREMAPGIHSVVDVPFSGGTLAVNSAEEDAFTDGDIEVLQQFAQVLSEAHRRLEDLKERRRLEGEVEQQRLQATESNRLQTLGEMAAGVAHELNQPLNAIRVFAEGAAFGASQGWQITPQQTSETFNDIVALVDRMTAIIDHMRVYARDISTSEARVFTFAEVVDGALKLVGAQLRVHGIDVSVDMPADLPAALGHPTQIEQVVINVLTNSRDALEARMAAARAREPWTPEIRLVGSVAERGRGVRLAISDNGGGIREDALGRVFDPFYTTKEVGKGTGLGLAIAREIARKHGGLLDVDSRPGQGATFTITLPVAGEHEEEHRAA